jgi:hypothetical protein
MLFLVSITNLKQFALITMRKDWSLDSRRILPKKRVIRNGGKCGPETPFL